MYNICNRFRGRERASEWANKQANERTAHTLSPIALKCQNPEKPQLRIQWNHETSHQPYTRCAVVVCDMYIVNPIKEGVANKTSTLSECWHMQQHTEGRSVTECLCASAVKKKNAKNTHTNTSRDKQTATNIHHFDFVEMPPSISAQSDKQKRRYLNNNAFCRFSHTLCLPAIHTLLSPPIIVHSISTLCHFWWSCLGKISIGTRDEQKKKLK